MESVKAKPDLIPTPLKVAVVALLMIVLAVVGLARLTDQPLIAEPAMDAPVAAERLIFLHGEMDGAAVVQDQTGAVIARLSPEEGGFVAGVQRALALVRGRHGVDEHAPVRLIRFEGGRLALVDDYTGWRVELIGFGADNTAAFARLLDS